MDGRYSSSALPCDWRAVAIQTPAVFPCYPLLLLNGLPLPDGICVTLLGRLRGKGCCSNVLQPQKKWFHDIYYHGEAVSSLVLASVFLGPFTLDVLYLRISLIETLTKLC